MVRGVCACVQEGSDGTWSEGIFTWSRFERLGSHFSVASPPCQVPKRLKHTYHEEREGRERGGWGGEGKRGEGRE